MAFDPFGDRETHGYLRNRLRTNDHVLIRQLEARAFATALPTALKALRERRAVTYDDVLSTHKTLFGSVYPWAGQDRAALAPTIAISRAGQSDLFAHPADVRRATEYGLTMGLDRHQMTANPGEVFGALAYAHPFLEGNGRTLLTVHADLARRAGFHIDWNGIEKDAFLMALTAELRKPRSAMDALIAPHMRSGALPVETQAIDLQNQRGLQPHSSPATPSP